VCDEATANEQDAVAAIANAALYKRGRRSHFAENPVMQLYGPLMPVLVMPAVSNSSHHVSGFGQNYHR
jgi:hypothetical protein